jgi:ATP-dependent DNA ligase
MGRPVEAGELDGGDLRPLPLGKRKNRLARLPARPQPGIVRRDGEAVRLFTRRGYDWTDRYPAIAAAAAKLRAKSFTLDGEAVVAADGVAVFDARPAKSAPNRITRRASTE